MGSVSLMCAGSDERSSGSSRSKVCRILIASGDQSERAAWRALLKDPIYEIIEVENGIAALKAIKKSGLDLVIAAVSMAKMDGLELLRTAREVPDAPPIIVIARGLSEMNHIYLKTAALLGAAGAYMEPLQADDFVRGIRALLVVRPQRSDLP
jgi:CheY-like chemotaxis protein